MGINKVAIPIVKKKKCYRDLSSCVDGLKNIN